MKGEEKGRGFLSRCRQRKVIPGGDGGGSNGGVAMVEVVVAMCLTELG